MVPSLGDYPIILGIAGPIACVHRRAGRLFRRPIGTGDIEAPLHSREMRDAPMKHGGRLVAPVSLGARLVWAAGLVPLTTCARGFFLASGYFGISIISVGTP